MTALNPSLRTDRVHPGWMFALLWIVAGYAGGILYVVPVSAVHFLLGLDRLGDSPRAGEITAPMMVLAAVLCGAACGSTIGLAQWLVLRRELKRTGMWVAATIAGYGSIGILPLIGGLWQPGWPDWAFTLIVNGKLHWLARVDPAWPDSLWLPGAITPSLFGLVLGAAQWPVLRGRVRHAGWWIALSAAGWAASALLTLWVPGPLAVFLSWDVPLIAGAVGLVWLLRRSTQPDSSRLAERGRL